MVCIPARPRVVIVGQGVASLKLAALFESHSVLLAWDAIIAQSVEHARFLIQMQACNALVVDQSAISDPQENVLGWLTSHTAIPLLFLSDAEPVLLQHALAQGIRFWLPCDLVLEHPVVLAEALRRVQQGQRRQTDYPSTDDCHARIERLAELLWNALPVEGRLGWFSQRFLLERLHEEVVRSDRHHTPLTVVLGELALDAGEQLPQCGLEQAIRDWIVERVLRGKRRSDVVGQYGEHGFLLLLPHTSADGAGEVCRRLRRDLEQAPWRLHASFGVASFSSEHRTPKSLLRLAEEELDTSRLTGTTDSSALPERTS
jgi:diguanylate cyclase (GGDEF)-like protein